MCGKPAGVDRRRVGAFCLIVALPAVALGAGFPDESACLPRFAGPQGFYLSWRGAYVFRDFNRDGLGDFALFSDTARVYLGRRDKTFHQVQVPEAQDVTFGEVGDFNSDGALDIVLPVQPSGGWSSCSEEVPSLKIFPGRYGGERFGEPVEIKLPGLAKSMAAYDLDLDGACDLLVVLQCVSRRDHYPLYLLRGTAEGASLFSEPVRISYLEPSREARGLRFLFGDLNGDELCDFVVWEKWESAEVYLADPGQQGGFRKAAQLKKQSGENFWDNCALLDVDADGILDLYVFEEPRFSARGTIPEEISYTPEGRCFLGGPDASFPRYTGALPLVSSRQTVFADFDGDSVIDIAHISNEAVIVWKGRQDPQDGTVSFRRTLPYYFLGSDPTVLLTADFDGDGVLDLAARSFPIDETEHRQGFFVAFGSRRGRLFSTASVLVTFKPPVGLLARDLDGDGLVDIAFSGPQHNAFAPEGGTAVIPEGYGVFLQRQGPYGMYFEGPEFFRFGEGPYALWAEEFCSPSADLPAHLTEIPTNYYHGPLAAEYDINGDGLKDSIFIRDNSTCPTCPRYTELLVNLGKRTRGIRTEPEWTGGKAADWIIDAADGTKGLTAADFNGDGIRDIAVGGYHGRVITVFFGLPSCHGKRVFLRGDVNSDGGIDISDAVYVLWYLFLRQSVECLEAADVNGDGRLNVADPIELLLYLFDEGAPPAPPFPFYGPCE